MVLFLLPGPDVQMAAAGASRLPRVWFEPKPGRFEGALVDLAGDLGEVDRLAAGQRMICCGDHDQRVADQRSTVDVDIVRWHAHDIEIVLIARQAFKQTIADADGLLLATPEYNFGIPGVLKNAIDWASRGYNGRSLLRELPVAIAGVSGGQFGTAAFAVVIFKTPTLSL